MVTHKKNPFMHDGIFWSGVAAIVFTVLMMLWLKNAEVHGSRLLDVAHAVSARYELAGVFFMLYIGGTIIPVPIDPIFTLALRLPYGVTAMTLLALLANLLGSLTNFYLARLLGHGWVRRTTGHKSTKKVLEWFKSHGPAALVVFGILPLPVFDVLTVFAGLSEMDTKKFLLYSIIGRSVHFVILVLTVMKVVGV